MKAHVYHQYGGPEVVHLEEVAKPAPGANELLVKVLATTVTAGDWRALTLAMPPGFAPFGRLAFGVTRPRKPILGMEFAGVVEAAGPSVTRFRAGDAVFGSTGGKMGAHAEYVTIAEDAHVAAKPENVTFEEAAALSFGGSTALWFLGRAKLARGERVLVVGASGGVGTAMVQLAKHLGAHVTGVTSAANVELVASLGADRVVVSTREDALSGGERYDVIVDTVGDTGFARAKPALADGGRLLAVATDLRTMLTAPFGPRNRRKRVVAGVAQESRAMAERIAELAKEGVLRPVIDRRYAFSEMREAHARVASRRKRGNVVVLVRHDG